MFLQFIWQHRLFDEEEMEYSDGSVLKILSVGLLNRDAGPDFFNARIQTGSVVWAGNVEIHRRSAEWHQHHHDLDPAYDNVILHVVEKDDAPVYNSKGERVLTVQMHYDPRLKNNYEELMSTGGWSACASSFNKVNQPAFQLWFHRLMVGRLEQKTEELTLRLKHNCNDWNETFYQFLARNFGFKVNAVPFEMLAKAVPLRILARHKDQLFQLEALLFGTAGLLNEELIGDPYFLNLKKEYSHLYAKYHLSAMEGHLWKFLRLRPVNFPTIRIAQFAALIHRSSALFSRLIEIRDLREVQKLFELEASAYWTTHYRFNRMSSPRMKRFGNDSFHNLVINTIVPFMFVYGSCHDDQSLKELALDYLDQLPAENNEIIHHWKELGVSARSAFDSQALLQLKTHYCQSLECVNCMIGSRLIQDNFPLGH